MLPEAGAFELVFLAMVALIVVGPKDLPVLLRKVGQFTAKMRGLAGEFRASFDEMARQSELDELRREVEALRDGRFGEGTGPEPASAAPEAHGALDFGHPPHAEASVPDFPAGPAAAPVEDQEPELPLGPPVAAPASPPPAAPARAGAAH